MASIIVGIDGSPASTKVLTFALKEASAHDLPLTVVAVHVAPAAVPAWGMPSMSPRQEEVDATRAGAQELLDSVTAGLGGDAPKTTLKVVPGVPADVILNEATADDLLVVGSRGAGGWRRLFLGAVSNDVVLAAPCPVTVVPTRD